MFKTVSCVFVACALAIASAGCAAEVPDSEEAEPDLVSDSHAALSGASTPKGAAQLYARATFDPNLGVTMVDVATTSLPNIGTVPTTDPHNSDEFTVVMVYVERDGRRDVLRVLGKNQIGPGGGCIHFNIVAGVGDRLFIGGVVRINGKKGATVGVAEPVTVTNGNWQDDPTVNQHPS